MKRRKELGRIACLMLLFSLLLLAGCSNNAKNGEQSKNGVEKLTVAVTIVPEQTFVEAVCGDLVDVVTMVPPGSSPENYEPTPQQIQKFSKANVYFAIGVPIEQTYILPNAVDMNVVALQDKVAQIYPDRTFESGDRDPHIWLSPKRAEVMVDEIADEMGKLDEKNKDLYRQNANNYIAQLQQLDQEIKTSLEGVKNRKFIVYHPAFGYIAEDYGLEMVALEEEGKEATIQHLKDMIDMAKKENIKVIFYQEEIDSSQSEAYAEEIEGKTVMLEPLAADYIDNLKKMTNTMVEVMQ